MTVVLLYFIWMEILHSRGEKKGKKPKPYTALFPLESSGVLKFADAIHLIE